MSGKSYESWLYDDDHGYIMMGQECYSLMDR